MGILSRQDWFMKYKGKCVVFLRKCHPRTKYLSLLSVDFLIFFVSIVCLYMLRVLHFGIPPLNILSLLALGPLLSVSCSAFFGVYGSLARAHLLAFENKIFLSQFAATVVYFLVALVAGVERFPYSLILSYGLMAVVLMIASRRFLAWFFADFPKDSLKSQNIAIYGVDKNSLLLLRVLEQRGVLHPKAFIEDEPSLIGRRLSGIKIYGRSEMSTVLNAFEISTVLLAKSDLSRAARFDLMEFFSGLPVSVKVVPDIEKIVDGTVEVTPRALNIEDVLGRDSVQPRIDLMSKAVSERSVLITGAGGSIGSELFNQILAYQPSKIVLFEHNEFSLFEVFRKFSSLKCIDSGKVQVVPVLGSVLNQRLLEKTMAEHKISAVFHAAAYKHVDLVQRNVCVGVENNVFGSLCVAQAASRMKADLCVLISTDKAVRPTGVMGASKRVAELVFQAMASSHSQKTIFTMVRFGNVLGSTGSVVPIFKEQIERGGPVTVTHPEVVRYFMSISEAAQLVVQAAAMARGGEVYVLDMGEPVKILELAKTMLRLAGLSVKEQGTSVGEEVEIVFTGLKTGEKLYEELLIGGDVTSTSHDRIMRCEEESLSLALLNEELGELRRRLDLLDEEGVAAHVLDLARLHLLAPVRQKVRA